MAAVEDKSAQQEEADRIYERLRAQAEAAQAAKDEEAEVLEALYFEEQEARAREKEQAKAAKAERMRQELVDVSGLELCIVYRIVGAGRRKWIGLHCVGILL